jgi:hypothetical protein
MARTYIGDGLYIEIERGMLKITAEFCEQITDTIYLEPQVFDALIQWVRARTVLDLSEPIPMWRDVDA